MIKSLYLNKANEFDQYSNVNLRNRDLLNKNSTKSFLRDLTNLPT